MTIPLFRPICDVPRCIDAIQTVLESGQLAEGPRVKQFELELEKVMGFPVVATNSGTSALHLAYTLAGIDREDHVISTPMTCLATNLPLLHLGAHIFWADVDEEGLVDPRSVDRIRKWHWMNFGFYPRAIVGVDYGGISCDWEALGRIAYALGVLTIQDAAHAFLMAPNSEADYSCYSFQAIKHLTTGDGGALKCKSREDTERAKRLRWFGLDRNRGGFRCEQSVSEAGYKFHMNDIQAAMGLANLPSAIAAVEWSRDNAKFYSEELKGIPGLELPRPKCDVNPSWWSYVLRVPKRAEFIAKMEELGVQCARIHSRNDVHPIFKNAITPFPLKGVERFDAMQVSIPVGFHVCDRERNHIVEAVRRAAKCW